MIVGSVVAAQHVLAMAVVARRADRAAVAHAVMRRVILPRRQAVTRRVTVTRRIAVAIARTRRIAVIAGSRTVRAEVRTRPVAVDRGAFDGDAALLRRYLENVEKEHRTIFEAISAKSPRKARAAMRRHLLNGKERYRQLAAEPEK